MGKAFYHDREKFHTKRFSAPNINVDFINYKVYFPCDVSFPIYGKSVRLFIFKPSHRTNSSSFWLPSLS